MPRHLKTTPIPPTWKVDPTYQLLQELHALPLLASVTAHAILADGPGQAAERALNDACMRVLHLLDERTQQRCRWQVTS